MVIGKTPSTARGFRHERKIGKEPLMEVVYRSGQEGTSLRGKDLTQLFISGGEYPISRRAFLDQV
jgi:hypothetical protein